MDEARVAIDDLYALALPYLSEWQRPANVHFTEQGYRKLAESVASSILGYNRSAARRSL